jgi:glutathione peroxidase
MKQISTLILALSSFLIMAFSYNKFNTKTVHDFTIKTINGLEINLATLKGKKILIVNVASECGYTPQYKNLQLLSERYKDKLVVLGFPSNDFGAQEPGTNTEIQTFCTKNYGVTFPIMDKINVIGKNAHPLYLYLSNKELNGVTEKAPTWNFCKYLIDENGKIIQFFPSKIDPLSEELTKLI